MAGEALHGHPAGTGLEHRPGLARSAHADGVAERHLVAAHVVEIPGHLRDLCRRNFALVGAPEDAGNIASDFHIIFRGCFRDGTKRSSDSAIEQLMFLRQNASEAAPKIATSVAPAARAASKPLRFGVSTG